MDVTVNVWAVLVAAVVYFVLGAGWYMAWSKPWMPAVGLTRDDVDGGYHMLALVVAGAILGAWPRA